MRWGAYKAEVFANLRRQYSISLPLYNRYGTGMQDKKLRVQKAWNKDAPLLNSKHAVDLLLPGKLPPGLIFWTILAPLRANSRFL